MSDGHETPRSAGFEPRASIFRGACAAPSGKDDDIEDMSIVARDGVIHFVSFIVVTS